MQTTRGKAAVLGAGAWGTVFAQILADAGNQVHLWGRREEIVAEINQGANSRYVPGVKLHGIQASVAIEKVVKDAELLVVAVPAQGVRSVLQGIKNQVPLHATLLSLVKGLESESLQFMHQVIAQSLGASPSRVVALSGPNLSAEIANREPTGAVVASSDPHRAAMVAARIYTPYFRPFTSDDVIGAEVGGVVKNIIAMVVGAAAGMGFGTNSRSFLITRGLAEMARLGIALGGRAETFLGMAGLGDLSATCASEKSRNFSFGYRLGQGMTLQAALAQSVGVVEGQRSCKLVLDLAKSLQVSMPITRAAYQVISGQASIKQMQLALQDSPLVSDGVEARLL